jgi:putative phosphoesterase
VSFACRSGVITVVSDTHGRTGHRLAGRTLEAVHVADLVCHAGDFLTETVLDAFEAESARFAGVIGNNDDAAVRERLPARRVVAHAGVELAMVHGHRHGATALELLGRETGVDLVVVGHSHRPGVRREGEVTVLNPGSHADPRQYRPAHAELDPGARRGRIVEPDGTLVEAFDLEG